MNTKLKSFYLQSFDIEQNIIVFTETWLRDNPEKKIQNTEIMCSKFQIYRRDRVGKEGGGVLIAVSTFIPSERIIINDVQDIEFVSIYVKLNNSKLYITCSYIPPASSVLIYEQHLKAIKFVVNQSIPGDMILVLGDFNLPNITWRKNPDSNFLIPSINSESYMDLVDSIADLGLFQINGISNTLGRLLDLAFVDQPDDFGIQRINPLLLPEDIHHPSFEINIFMQMQLPEIQHFNNEMVLDFKKADFTKLNNLLAMENMFLYYPYDNLSPHKVDLMLSQFYNSLFNCLEKSIPMKKIMTSNVPPWNTKQLRRLKNLKNKHYKNYRKTGLATDYTKYSVSRSIYNLTNLQCYNNYLSKVKRNFKTNPKFFYQFVNSKRRVSGYPSMMKYNDTESSNDTEICDMFAKFFSSSYSNVNINQLSSYPYHIPEATLISCSTLHSSTIMNAIQKLKCSNKCGPDGIPSCVLLNCMHSLIMPLTYLFNASLSTGYFPNFWKISFIIPLFKSGSRSSISNYRGIAKLSVIPKLFEKIVTDILSHQVASFLSPYQHGFRRGRSATTNLLEFTTSVISSFCSGMQTDTIYTDFSKAFDKVNHDLLIFKLDKLGLSPLFLKWISTYLKNRQQSVLFKNIKSKTITVLSGVPQGSHLGPVLFLIFINDLPSCIKHSKILMYADDVKLYFSLNDCQLCSLLQQDLDNFNRWCNVNAMYLNLRKCKYMIFHRRNPVLYNYVISGYQLEKVDDFLDLGVLLDPKLSFTSHISQTVNKAKGVLGFIKRWGKEFDDPYVTKQLFTSLVRPILEYACVVWDPQYEVHIKKIESVQKQFLLFCLRKLPWNPNIILPSYESRLALIRLPTLKSRRTYMNVSFIINLINGVTDSDLLLRKIKFTVPNRPTRNYIPLKLQFFSTNYANSDPIQRICSEFNNLYRFIDFSSSPNAIKWSIINFLN